jgi:thiamine transport system substrate-binding protein
MLSPKFQADVPLQMFVFPARDGVPLPKVFEQFAEVAPDPLTLPSDQISRHRDEWIQQWRATVLG